MTASSRRSSGRRTRALRALAERLDAELGPDESEIVYTFDDGWTVRHVQRLNDQVREGWMLHNCLREATDERDDDNCFSLRDPDNLPRVCFAAWSHSLNMSKRWTARAQVVEPNRLLVDARQGVIFGNGALLLVDGFPYRLTPGRRARLETFAGKHHPALPDLATCRTVAAVGVRAVLGIGTYGIADLHLPVRAVSPRLAAIYKDWLDVSPPGSDREDGGSAVDRQIEIEPIGGDVEATDAARLYDVELGRGILTVDNITSADVSVAAWDEWTLVGAALAQIKTPAELADYFASAPGIIERLPFAPDERVGYLQAIAVSPEYRGQGVGARLLAARIERLAELGVDRLIACAWSSQAFGCHVGPLLEKAGMRPIGRAAHFYNGWLPCPICNAECDCAAIVYVR
jgi:GNAT superfamily N-acetyltransferase